jgi:chromosome segregation ATPase
LKLSEEDQATIASLRKEIEKAWKMLDAAQERENKNRETISSLRNEITSLTTLVESGAGLSAGQESSVNELIRVKDELTKERDNLLSDLVELRGSLKKSEEKCADTSKDLRDCEARVSELQQDIGTKNNELQRETRKRERLERDCKQTKDDNDEKLAEIGRLQGDLEKARQESKALELQIMQVKVSTS